MQQSAKANEKGGKMFTLSPFCRCVCVGPEPYPCRLTSPLKGNGRWVISANVM